MTETRPPQTREEFHDQIERLIQRAESNDLDIAGGYEFQSATDQHAWEMELFRLVDRAHSTDEQMRR